jgi:uncharacterized membrane protein
MVQIPDPLHPAVVHFPIALIFLGTLISIPTIFTHRGALPQLTAFILVLAAAAAQVAVITGGDQADEVIQRMPDARPLVYRHAEWGLWTRNVAVAAACSAVLALVFYRALTFRRVLAFVTTVIASVACYCASTAADRGGEMVYHHGVGIEVKPVRPAAAPNLSSETPAVSPVSPSGR